MIPLGSTARRKAPYRVVHDRHFTRRPWVALHRWYGDLYRPLGWFATWEEAMDVTAQHARDTGRH